MGSHYCPFCEVEILMGGDKQCHHVDFLKHVVTCPLLFRDSRTVRDVVFEIKEALFENFGSHALSLYVAVCHTCLHYDFHPWPDSMCPHCESDAVGPIENELPKIITRERNEVGI